MNKPAAAGVAICCSVLVIALMLAVEFGLLLLVGIGFATVVDRHQGGSIGWDPVSLWNQSWRGKIDLTVIFLLPLILPVIAASIAYRLIFRRLAS